MTDREMRRLSRKELLEMLIEQSRENERLKRELEAAEKTVKARAIRIAEAGTLAEAAMNLNGVLEAADAAARQYLDNLRARTGLIDRIRETLTDYRSAHPGEAAELTATLEALIETYEGSSRE